MTNNFSWRTEPEIDARRQAELTNHRATPPNIEKGIYPFKGIKLSRADIEWLLATHENGHGPVDENQREREGLDLRGANLCGVNLKKLPLRNLQGGLTWDRSLTQQQINSAAVHAAVHLEGVDLSEAHLEDANFVGAHLENAKLYWAHLEGADLGLAHLEGATLEGTFFDSSTDLNNAELSDQTSVVDAHWGDVNLAVVRWGNVKMYLLNILG